MSFILDALRKAESLRGASTPVETPPSTLGVIAPQARPARRKSMLTGLAVGGVVAIGAIMWWSGRNPAPAPAAPVAAAPASTTGLPVDSTHREIRPLDRVVRSGTAAAAASHGNPPPERPTTARAADAITPGTVEVASRPLTASRNAVTTAPADDAPLGSLPPHEELPSYNDIVLSGRANLPPLHLDIHVYAQAPERRFVFVNNRKYREGERIDEGGRVDRITPDGVILEHRGYRFELLPD